MTKALKPPLQQNWQKKRLLKNSWLSERNCFEKCKVIMHILIKSYLTLKMKLKITTNGKNLITDIKDPGSQAGK